MVPFSLRLQLKFVNKSTQPFPQIGAYPIFSQLASQLQKGISLGKELQTSKQSFFLLQMTKEFLDKSQEKIIWVDHCPSLSFSLYLKLLLDNEILRMIDKNDTIPRELEILSTKECFLSFIVVWSCESWCSFAKMLTSHVI